LSQNDLCSVQVRMTREAVTNYTNIHYLMHKISGTTLTVYNGLIVWQVASDPTSFQVVGNQTDGLGTGSWFRLKEEVA